MVLRSDKDLAVAEAAFMVFLYPDKKMDSIQVIT
jgi:hypothetical protein